MESGDLRAGLLAALSPLLATTGVELVDVRIHPSGRRRVVCLLIEPFEVAGDGTRQPLTATVEDCARVSRQVGAVLDAEGLITFSYVLEVSSPGIDRPLRTPEHYARFVGERVVVRMADDYGPRRQFLGKLEGLSQGCVNVTAEDGTLVRLPLDRVVSARVQADPWKGVARDRRTGARNR